MNLRKAAQQALDEMLRVNSAGIFEGELNEAIDDLRAALAEPEQAPISLNNGRLTQYPDGSIGVGTPAEPEQGPVATWENKYGMKEWQVHAIRNGWMPAPTPRKPVELTDDEIALIVGECAASAHRHCDFSFARAVIAAYEAKNGITGGSNE